MLTRRQLLGAGGSALLSLPIFDSLLRRRAFADPAMGRAQRAIFFYFPDGVAGQSQNGDPTLWHASGTEHSFTLSPSLMPLAAHQGDCVFFNGLSMGPTDSGSHPGGAKKLLTAADEANGESIDQFLARTAGANAPWHHLYLGVQANQNNPSGDKHISYPSAGQSIAPEDDPLVAFQRLFGSGLPSPMPPQPGRPPVDLRISVLDSAMSDLRDLEARLGTVEKSKLDLHLDALRQVEARIKAQAMGGIGTGTGMGTGSGSAACSPAAPSGWTSGQLYAPDQFPSILRSQIDLMVSAMACGITQVGTIQCSDHTSDLIMSRFMGTEMYDPNFDMRSHQASHYGAAHDYNHREFSDYMKQIRWWVSQFAYLLDQLASRPEGDGTMLDHSLVFLCTEVCDGNTHSHDNMPFILAGKSGGAISTGRLLQFDYERHGKLLVSMARAMGQAIDQFGDSGFGPLAGL